MSNRAKGGFGDNPQNINRAGRPPKGQALTDILREQAEREDVDGKDGKMSRRDAIAQKLWQMALSGDIHAIKYMYDRLDGRARELHEISHVEPTPIVVTKDEGDE